GDVSSRSERYRARAEECQVRAETVRDPEVRLVYEQLAAQWRFVAQQASREGWEIHGQMQLGPLKVGFPASWRVATNGYHWDRLLLGSHRVRSCTEDLSPVRQPQ